MVTVGIDPHKRVHVAVAIRGVITLASLKRHLVDVIHRAMQTDQLRWQHQITSSRSGLLVSGGLLGGLTRSSPWPGEVLGCDLGFCGLAVGCTAYM